MNSNKVMKRIRITAKRIDIIVVKNIERVFILDSATFCFILKSCIIFAHTNKIKIIKHKKKEHDWTSIEKIERWCVIIKEYSITRVEYCLRNEKNFAWAVIIVKIHEFKWWENFNKQYLNASSSNLLHFCDVEFHLN